MIFRFGEFELETSSYELRRAGERIHLSRRAFDILEHLIQNRHKVVTRDDLVDLFWEGRAVTDGSLSQIVKSIRRALGEKRDGTRIETVRSRGYRFLGNDVTSRPQPERSGATGFASKWPEAETSSSLFSASAEEDECQLLVHALEAARAGNGALAVVTGPRHSGKTTLVRGLAARARALSMNVVLGRAHDGADALDWWLVLEILSSSSEATPLLGVVEDVPLRSQRTCALIEAFARSARQRKTLLVVTCTVEENWDRSFLDSLANGETGQVMLIELALESGTFLRALEHGTSQANELCQTSNTNHVALKLRTGAE